MAPTLQSQPRSLESTTHRQQHLHYPTHPSAKLTYSLFAQSRLMLVDETPANNPLPSETRAGHDFSNAPRLSTKLRDKINKLAKWRIYPSSIEFVEGTCEFNGGHATVSRALLLSTSDSGSGSGEPGVGGGKEESDMKKAIAVKKLRIENESHRERVLGLALREAGFLVELSHENVIELKGFVEGLSEGQLWLIFPWEENGNLKDFVASQDWEIPERISLINDVTKGVEYLHDRNPPIYHGDLKSINVLVTSTCRAVITDFGSARRLGQREPKPREPFTENRVQLALDFEATFCASTNTMTLTGNEYTLRWAAPELLMDDKPGLWSDIWSLGWIWYEVMTNSIPFQGVQKDAMIIKHVIQGNLPSVTDHARISLILRLCSLMTRCWSIDPTKRPTAGVCRKSIEWLPMLIPDPKRTSKSGASKAHSPELLCELGDMYCRQYDYTTASRFFADALDIFIDRANSSGKSLSLRSLAHVYRHQREYNKAAALYSQAMQICADIGDEKGRAGALWGLAKVYRHQKEYSKAIALYHEVIQISTDIDDESERANALWGLAGVHRAQRDYKQAVVLYAEATEIYTGMGDMLGRANTLWGMAETYRFQEQCSQAVARFSEALSIYTDLGDRSGRAWVLLRLADIQRDQGHHTGAVHLYEQAAEMFEAVGNTSKGTSASSSAARIRTKLL